MVKLERMLARHKDQPNQLQQQVEHPKKISLMFSIQNTINIVSQVFFKTKYFSLAERKPLLETTTTKFFNTFSGHYCSQLRMVCYFPSVLGHRIFVVICLQVFFDFLFDFFSDLFVIQQRIVWPPCICVFYSFFPVTDFLSHSIVVGKDA